MPSLSIHFVVGTLLLTTFVSCGLLGIWVGLSKWHWFIRSLVVVAVFLPLTLVPAYEPLLVLLIQVLVCAVGSNTYIVFTDVWGNSKSISGETGKPLLFLMRCSIADILLSMALAAILLFLFVRINKEELVHDWPNYLLTGFMVGSVVLASTWASHSQVRRVFRSLVVLLVATLASASLAYFNEWTEYITYNSFLEDSLNWPNVSSSNWTLVWVPIVIGLAFLIVVALWLLQKSRAYLVPGCGHVWEETSRQFTNRAFGFCFLLLVGSIVSAPVVTCWKLLNPQEMIQIQPPEPNGFESLVAAGQMFDSRILNTAVAPASTKQLAAEVEKYADAYECVSKGLSQDFANPRWYSQDSFAETQAACINAFSSFRNISYALSMKCDLARRESRYEDAATNAMMNLKLGVSIAKQGVLTDYLTGTAIEDTGRWDLFSVVGKLEPTRYQELVDELIAIQSNRDTLDEIVSRDRAWCENADGWQGHVFEYLWDIAGGYWVRENLHETIHPRYVTEARLLLLELALHAYRAKHAEFPRHLSELVPDFIPRVFEDPFSRKEEPFIYGRSDDGYTIYSLGQNRQDDGGVGQDETANGFTDWNTGDLRLELLYDE